MQGAGVHATAVVYGESGVLILGPSGAGKSALALALLSDARRTGRFGALVGDDRVYLRSAGGRLVAYGVKPTAGMIERRGAGLLRVASEPAAVIRLIVELSGRDRTWPRLPDDPDLIATAGISLPRLALNSSESASDQALAVADRLFECNREFIFRKTNFT